MKKIYYLLSLSCWLCLLSACTCGNQKDKPAADSNAEDTSGTAIVPHYPEFSPVTLVSDSTYYLKGHTYSVHAECIHKDGDSVYYRPNDTTFYSAWNTKYQVSVKKDGHLLFTRNWSKRDLLNEKVYLKDNLGDLPTVAVPTLPEFQCIAWNRYYLFTLPLLFPDSDFGEDWFVIMDSTGKFIYSDVGQGYGGGEVDGGYHSSADWLFTPVSVIRGKDMKETWRRDYRIVDVCGNRQINDSTVLYVFSPHEGDQYAGLYNMNNNTRIDSFPIDAGLMELGWSIDVSPVAEGRYWIACSPGKDSLWVIPRDMPLVHTLFRISSLPLCTDKSKNNTTRFYRYKEDLVFSWDERTSSPCLVKRIDEEARQKEWAEKDN